jgi:ribosomal 30S subunit maturation factor RimM
VLVVRHDGRDVLVPFVAAMVPSVELDQRRVVIVDEVGLYADDADDAVDAAATED